MYVCIYIYIYMYTCMCIYTYILSSSRKPSESFSFVWFPSPTSSDVCCYGFRRVLFVLLWFPSSQETVVFVVMVSVVAGKRCLWFPSLVV